MLAKLAFKQVRKSASGYVLYFLTMVLGVALVYAFGSLGSQPAVLDLDKSGVQLVQAVGRMLEWTSYVLMVVIGLLVLYVERFLARRRKKEFATFMLLGMNRGQLAWVIMLENLFVALIAFAAGIGLGVLLSLGLVQLTAITFASPVKGVGLYFSVGSCVSTAVLLAVIFVISTVINAGSLMATRLIDLIRAPRTNHKAPAKHPVFLSVVFVLSIALLGYSYATLMRAENLDPRNATFLLATGLMVVAVIGIFASASSLVVAVASRTKWYLRGLHMFDVRRFASRLHTRHASMTVVSLVLFLALAASSVGGALVIRSNADLEAKAPYQGTVTLTGAYLPDTDGTIPAGTDVVRELEAFSAPDVKPLSQIPHRSVTATVYNAPGAPIALISRQLPEGGAGILPDYVANRADDINLAFMRLSDYNALRELRGAKPVKLDDGQAWVLARMADRASLDKVLAHAKKLEVDGRSYALSPERASKAEIATEVFSSDLFVFVVPDSELPANALPTEQIADFAFTGSDPQAAEADFTKLGAAFDKAKAETTGGAPAFATNTRQAIADASRMLTGVVAFEIVFVAFVFLICCAALVSVQQLSDAMDARRSFAQVSRLGAEQRAISRSVFWQMAAGFFLPLVVAAANVVCVWRYLYVHMGSFGVDGSFVGVMASIAAVVAVTYLAYFLAAFVSARRYVVAGLSKREG